MWIADQIIVDIDQCEGDEVILTIITPLGKIDIAGNIRVVERTLYVEGAHIQGLWRGALHRKGLNALGRILLEYADVDEILIQGGKRTTGKNRGKSPKPIRFPHN